jgi:acetyltransferase-like isoleucine patch superfamily enzyme
MRKIIVILKFIYNTAWTKINPNSYAERIGVRLGKNVKFYAMKAGMFSTEPWLITIGDDCFITANCQFVTHDGGTLILRKEIPDLEITAPITIGNDVYIGLNTTILAGTKVGNRCIIGACSLVKGEFPDNSVIAGVPARVIKTVDEYLEQIKSQSLHFGHLSAAEKEKALKAHFNIKY